jgi:cytochrome c biogenesis protein
MNIRQVKKSFRIFTNLKFSILILTLIAFASSLGSVIEQEESLEFYQTNYSLLNPIYGFINWKLIISFGLDHIYTTFWFLALLIILGISLISCSITRQFPVLNNSKDYFFKRQKTSFLSLPFSIKLKNIFFLKESILVKLQKMNFYIYQYGNLVYGYKGLIGRISPILVHLSLIIILVGSSWGAFNNFKAQEILPKGEIFHIQNPIKIGGFTNIPSINTRVNDFWVEYNSNRIQQFYSDLSILNSTGNEIVHQTISVNNPLRYKNIDFYQSDWNLLGIRIKDITTDTIYELPLFTLKNSTKSWVTWVFDENSTIKTLIFDQLQNHLTVYDENGKFVNNLLLDDKLSKNLIIVDIIPATGLQIKYDPSIALIYFGFGLLMLTAFLSYLPYTQIWMVTENQTTWIGSNTNRGKIKLEIEFENLIRSIEEKLSKSLFILKS